jgi:di/tricarboxylate transporter
MQTALLLFLLGVALLLFVTQWVPLEVTSLGLILALALSGILTADEALSGFSSPATVTVLAMLVLSAGVERAGVVDTVAARLASLARGSTRRLLLALALPAVAFSAFMNNTPVVALLIPVALTLARRTKQAPSQVLLPISYFSILGGTCTLIGTSTNLLVDGLSRASGGPGIGMFELTPLGLVYMGVGSAYLLVFAPRLLPQRTGFAELISATAPGHFVAELVVPPASSLDGRTVAAAFPGGGDVRLLEVVRGEEPILQPGGEFVLRAGDVLFVESTARSLHQLLAGTSLELGQIAAEGLDARRVDLSIAEAVITPTSGFTGWHVRDLGLARRRGVLVLGVRRLGRFHQARLQDLRLRAGDVLLVQGEARALHLLQEEGDVLLIEGVERELTFPRRAPVALGTLLAVVVLASLGVAPVVLLALGGVAVLLATRCIDPRSALRAVDPAVLLLLAGTIPLGLALERVGLATRAAGWVVELLGERHPVLLVGGIYVLTSLLTTLLSNTATAVLLTPLVLGLADQLGVDARPLLVAVAFGASACFASPIGYQTNAMVMGPGGYTFRDYVRLGLPLNLLLAVLTAWLIPVLWPFHPA